MLWFSIWFIGLSLHCFSAVMAAILIRSDRGARTASGVNLTLFVANVAVCIKTLSALSRGHPTAQFNAHSDAAMAAWMAWMDVWPTLFGGSQALIVMNVMATLIIVSAMKQRLLLVPGVLGTWTSFIAIVILGLASPRA